jgi:lactoylglutathione lyase
MRATRVLLSSRPFRVLGLQQVAVGAPRKADLRHLWSDLLGVPTLSTFRSERENVDEDILHLGVPSSPFAVELDLMEPIDAARAPRVADPPLNHIGIWVDHLPECVQWLTTRGVRFTPGGIRKGASGHDVTFIHPKASGDFPVGGSGVLIELVQAPEAVVRAFDAAAAAAGAKPPQQQ